MNWYTRHPRLMKRFLTACHASPEFMTVAELAALSNTSSKRVTQFIQILESYGYMFRTRVNAKGVAQYRLIIEPFGHKRNHLPCIEARPIDDHL